MVEKDKTIAELLKKHSNNRSGSFVINKWDMALLEGIYEAARADAIEECAKIADEFAAEDGGNGWKVATKAVAAKLRSLSRKQEAQK